MNGLEDALHDYLAQLDEPTPAKSGRYVASLEQKLIEAGQLPAKGKISMTPPPSPPDKPTPIGYGFMNMLPNLPFYTSKMPWELVRLDFTGDI